MSSIKIECPAHILDALEENWIIIIWIKDKLYDFWADKNSDLINEAAILFFKIFTYELLLCTRLNIRHLFNNREQTRMVKFAAAFDHCGLEKLKNFAGNG